MASTADELSPPASLLLQYAHLPPGGNLLLTGCEATLCRALASRLTALETIVATHFSFTALQAAQEAFARAGVRHASYQEADAVSGKFDAAWLQLPKGRTLARRWLVQAHQALAPGGRLYIAGMRQQGIEPLLSDARQLFGSAEILGYQKGSRVALCLKEGVPPTPDWVCQAGVSPGSWLEFSASLAGSSFQLRCLPGVFSAGRLDEGSALLLEAVIIPQGTGVLDIGCGWGALGLAAAGKASHVDMVDENLLAVASAQENIRLAGLSHARAWPADGAYDLPSAAYDCILTNPPFHDGGEVDYSIAEGFIHQAKRCLAPQGRFWLVANRFIRYNRLLGQVFPQVEVVAQTGKFHVLAAAK